ncbi:hypothetical protein [Chamaesiphon minutus]|uniref:Uncharacterized protein n=1 Tax=Chamaesiphon minutus (strain ATCC 27169 / PCC 6605) TaxID=1173020 RepID=K9UDC6_CHAP6|nr:hypothetical protein [Chamaesiphon minutus]AFY93122.1 hypothetical protein Cha6605_2021 [Chamaesiphon minutus PCC 6605]
MKNYRLLTIIGASIASLFSSWLPAIAQPVLTYNGVSTYKDSKDNIYIVSSGGVEITYTGVNATRTITSDACGYARISFNEASSSTPTEIVAGGTTNTISSLPSVLAKTGYKCVAGVAQWGNGAQTGAFKQTVSGNTITTNVYFPPAQTGGANKQLSLAYTVDLTSIFRDNTCGFTVFPGYATRRSSATPFRGSTAINVVTLPLNPAPPKCANNRAITSGGNGSQGGATMYRTKSAIYLTGLTAGSINNVDYNALESKFFPNLSPCGAISIDLKTLQPVTLKAGSTTYTSASMTVTPFADLQCNSPSFASALADRLYKIDNARFVYKTSDPTTKRFAVEIPTVVNRKIPVNQCGFSTIPALNRSSGFTTGDRVTINGSTPYDPLTLPLVANAPQCMNGTIYTPQ